MIPGAIMSKNSLVRKISACSGVMTLGLRFEPYKGTRRKPGTGCLHQINDHLWEGKYSPRGPDGKRIHKNVYAPTKEECEEKLQALIDEILQLKSDRV